MHSKATLSYISTTLGKIAIYQRVNTSDKLPILFLHGVYFDHYLWDEIVDNITDRTIITLDMPLHGASREISKTNWTLNDCAEMLLEIVHHLQLSRVFAVGHSWGSMTLLRAANKQSERFEGLLLCNMPFKAATRRQKVLFRLQHLMLVFRNFYTRQAALALFGKGSLNDHPLWIEHLKRSMNLLTNEQIAQIDKKVILDAEDTTELVRNLTVKAIALKGEEDYVPTPTPLQTILVGGGHISPLEAPEDLLSAIHRLINSSDRIIKNGGNIDRLNITVPTKQDLKDAKA